MFYTYVLPRAELFLAPSEGWCLSHLYHGLINFLAVLHDESLFRPYRAKVVWLFDPGRHPLRGFALGYHISGRQPD
jgi:hypothetical protein